jgi:hypothetical protein
MAAAKPTGMAEESSSTGIVAIFAILFIVAMAAFLAWRGGLFGGRGGDKDLNIKLDTSSAYVAPLYAA